MTHPRKMKIAQLYNKAVYKGIETGDWNFLESCFIEMSEYEGDPSVFPEGVFEQITQLLSTTCFLQATGSHNVLRLLQYDWDILSDDQKQKLLSLFEESYFKFKDTLSCFLIAEILGLRYCNAESLDLLNKLSMGALEDVRVFIPMGFFNIASNSSNAQLRIESYRALARMRNDISAIVRAEATNLLAQLPSVDGDP